MPSQSALVLLALSGIPTVALFQDAGFLAHESPGIGAKHLAEPESPLLVQFLQTIVVSMHGLVSPHSPKA